MRSIPIKRVSQTTDQTSPWDGVVFIYEVGSDELSEALKACYPHYRTLRQRKHAAIIDFLKHELSGMLSGNITQPSTRSSPLHDMPSISADHGESYVDAQSSVQSQNILPRAQSPASSNSSLAVQEKRERFVTPLKPATQPVFIDPTTATHSSQFVFNVVDGRTMQQKTKRKMTAEERMEYNATRKRGACSRCKRQKGKCTHLNDTESSLGSPSVIADQFKSRISLNPDSHDPKLSKTSMFRRTIVEDSNNSDPSQKSDLQQQHEQSTYSSRRSSNASMLSTSGPVSPQWSNSISDGSQLGMPGYVQQSYSFEQTQSFVIDDQPPSCWTDFNQDNVDPVHNLNSSLSEATFEHNQDGIDYPGFPSIRVHEPEQNLHSGSEHSSFRPWNLGQQPFPDNTGFT